MYRKLKYLMVLWAFLFLQGNLLIGASNPSSFSGKKWNSVVSGKMNKPVAGALIMDLNHKIIASTNEDGTFSVELNDNSEFFIVAEGYQEKMVNSAEINESIVQMVPITDKVSDNVAMAFGTMSMDKIAGDVTVLNANDILKMDMGQSVIEAIRGRVPGMFGPYNLRNYGTVAFIIDGLERSPSYLSLNEVEQIVILKDATARMLIGTKANAGVVLITTKRGKAGQRLINSQVEYGIGSAIDFPEFMNSYDYARYYNEARSNDGLPALYSDEQLAGYQSADRIRYADEDYYNSTFLRKFSSQGRFSLQFQGGNENTRYFLNLTGMTSNSLLNVGQGKKQGNDDFSVRANVDTKISSEIKLKVDLASYFGFGNYARGDFFGNAASFRPNDYPIFIPVDAIPESSSEILTSASIVNNSILGGNQTYQTNIYGDLKYGGYRKTVNRVNQVNSSLDIDLSSVLKGLRFEGGILFDMSALQTIQQVNTYSVYEPLYTGNELTGIKKYNIDQETGSQSVTNTDVSRRFGYFGNFEYSNSIGNSDLYANLIGYGETYSIDAVLQPERLAHYGLRVNYGYKKKYLAEFDAAYSGSRYLPSDNRFHFAPSLGVAWVLSNEDFMAENSLVNLLKLRASFGIINSDEGFSTYHAYETAYQYEGGSYAYGGLTGDYSSKALRYKSIANPNLGFGKRADFNLGFDGSFFGNVLDLKASYFHRTTSDEPTRVTNAYPAYLGDVYPLENYGKNIYNGFEAEVLLHKEIGDFRYAVGGNFVFQKGKVVEMDEPYYEYDYLKRTGKETGAIFSYVAEGLFKDEADISSHATQTFGDVFPGDIKYKDMNNDGVIDQNDLDIVGNYSSKIYYGLNVALGYKNFNLFALGSGQAGGDIFLQSLNEDYYWVRGNNKYPSYLADSRWTPETAGSATYPRLTTKESSNNYRNSSFWLRKNNWFRLHTLQLSYTLPKSVFKEGSKLNNVKLYLRGSNLMTISKISKELDMNVGKTPSMRYYVIGINANF